MDLFAQLKNADKIKLKKVKTVVKTESGKKLIEQRGEEGTTVTECDDKCEGFVVDLKPDLCVGRVTNDVLIGNLFYHSIFEQTTLHLGSQDVAHNFDMLKRCGVSHILNVASGVQNAFQDSFVYKNVEMLDTPDFDLQSCLSACIEFIDDCRKASGVCLVHCNAGVSRSASVVIAYLIHTRSITYEEAFDIVKRARPCINPNSGFVNQLKLWHSSRC
ncbi:dual specificity protein phosphatase 19-like protein [Leptotrombidium deliense]|uniref:Dual specificity protein phosphatase 19-like protein n=1 Tax=Leptotrombidium deliense TaxID=299467 RepID=A0A443SMC3_9ACAR|nr:dual specificity protein phosphatase 19-like protein [Leptotrombidium deliense]